MVSIERSVIFSPHTTLSTSEPECLGSSQTGGATFSRAGVGNQFTTIEQVPRR